MRRKKKRAETDFYLNIVPILDCLTILVVFLLMSGVYLSIGVLDIQISSESGELTENQTPEAEISIRLKARKTIHLNVSSEKFQERRIRIRSQGGNWDLKDLKKHLRQFQKKWPSVKSITLISDLNVPYEDLVSVMDTTRKTHQDVLLGGF